MHLLKKRKHNATQHIAVKPVRAHYIVCGSRLLHYFNGVLAGVRRWEKKNFSEETALKSTVALINGRSLSAAEPHGLNIKITTAAHRTLGAT